MFIVEIGFPSAALTARLNAILFSQAMGLRDIAMGCCLPLLDHDLYGIIRRYTRDQIDLECRGSVGDNIIHVSGIRCDKLSLFSEKRGKGY